MVLIVLLTPYSSYPFDTKRLNNLYLKNKTDENIIFLLINTNDLNCEIGEIGVNKGYYVGTGQKKRLLIIKNSSGKFFVYYLGFMVAIHDLDYIDISSFTINLALLPNYKIYVINKNASEDLSRQPSPQDFPKGQFPIQSGYYKNTQQKNISFSPTGITIDFDNPNLDYRSYNLERNKKSILKACFSIFN